MFTSGFKGESLTDPGVVDEEEELSTPRSGSVFVLVPVGSCDPVVGIVAVAMEPLAESSPVLVMVTVVVALFVVIGSSVMATMIKKSIL